MFYENAVKFGIVEFEKRVEKFHVWIERSDSFVHPNGEVKPVTYSVWSSEFGATGPNMTSRDAAIAYAESLLQWSQDWDAGNTYYFDFTIGGRKQQ